MGYWKGSGLSVMLDAVGTVLSAGNSVQQIGTFGDEVGLTQIMIAIDPGKMNTTQETDKIADAICADLHSSIPEKEGGKVRYPGEREYYTRQDNLKNGVPVIDEVWQKIIHLENRYQ